MKKFRVYFKDGKSIVVTATGFIIDRVNQTIQFLKDKDEADDDIFVKYDEVIAIIPKGDTPEEGGSRSITAY